MVALVAVVQVNFPAWSGVFLLRLFNAVTAGGVNHRRDKIRDSLDSLVIVGVDLVKAKQSFTVLCLDRTRRKSAGLQEIE